MSERIGVPPARSEVSEMRPIGYEGGASQGGTVYDWDRSDRNGSSDSSDSSDSETGGYRELRFATRSTVSATARSSEIGRVPPLRMAGQ